MKNFISTNRDNGSGTSYSRVYSGLNTYLEGTDTGIKCGYTKGLASKTVLKEYIQLISSNRACIVGLKDDPIYSNHWCLGLGYVIYEGASSKEYACFFKVNDGHYVSEKKKSPIVYVNYAYVDGIIYI